MNPVDAIVTDARKVWVSTLSQYTELPQELFMGAFEQIIKIGIAAGRAEAAFEFQQYWTERMTEAAEEMKHIRFVQLCPLCGSDLRDDGSAWNGYCSDEECPFDPTTDEPVGAQEMEE